jgi:DNA invertase Pin-like site-specific DNA recombinase
VTRLSPAFVTYLRVSTDQQGRSGLGLEAQRAAVAVHVGSTDGRIVAEHVEVESGRKKDRPPGEERRLHLKPDGERR